MFERCYWYQLCRCIWQSFAVSLMTLPVVDHISSRPWQWSRWLCVVFSLVVVHNHCIWNQQFHSSNIRVRHSIHSMCIKSTNTHCLRRSNSFGRATSGIVWPHIHLDASSAECCEQYKINKTKHIRNKTHRMKIAFQLSEKSDLPAQIRRRNFAGVAPTWHPYGENKRKIIT